MVVQESSTPLVVAVVQETAGLALEDLPVSGALVLVLQRFGAVLDSLIRVVVAAGLALLLGYKLASGEATAALES